VLTAADAYGRAPDEAGFGDGQVPVDGGATDASTDH
jgi:hypothetical protein